MSQPLFQLKAVNKNYYPSGGKRFFSRRPQTSGVNALNNINLEIFAGEIFVIVGLSGSGKSTLLRTLNHLIPASSGEVIFQGQTLAALPPSELIALRRQHIGMVFQSFALFEERSVLDNVLLPLSVVGLPARDAQRRARAALDKVGLLARERARPIALSGGEQQRLAIARAVVNRPSLLLADEPTANLDSDSAGQILDLFRSFHQVGVTLVVATHDPQWLRRISPRVLSLEHGRLIADSRAATVRGIPPQDPVDAPKEDMR